MPGPDLTISNSTARETASRPVTVITSQRRWTDLNLAELIRYKDLIMLFVRRDFISVYKQTILGPFWYLLQPLISSLVFTIIFSRVAGISTDGVPAFIFYMAGITSWSYFASCLNKTSDIFFANQGIYGKVYFPRLVIPVSVVISNMITFGFQFVFFLIFLSYYYFTGAAVKPNAMVLLTPVLLLLMAGLGLGAGIIVSALTTKYRDLKFLVGFGVQLMMYASPVIFPLSTVTGKMRMVLLANPMTSIIETFKYAFLGAGEWSPMLLAYTAVFTLLTLLTGLVLFNRIEKVFIDTV